MSKKTTFGVIVGNRGFFPDHLAVDGRKEILGILEQQGYGTVCVTPEDTYLGSVVTREDAHKCADLFKAHADCIDGILITLPNFGEERGIADALRLAGLDVPVLVQAYPDDLSKLSLADRRDSFCGKMSCCNNLTQYGVDYSLTSQHTMDPNSAAFAADLKWFGAVCRVVKGLKGARIGAIGTRPAAFNTVRYSEKILEANGISVEPIDLSEILARIEKLDDAAECVQKRLNAVKGYICLGETPDAALMKMAKFAAVVDEWMQANELQATAVQCWTSIEENYGIVPCGVMSMMSERLVPGACEVDVTGAIGMYSLVLAAEQPAALVDWNNNYGDDPDKCVVFHCSNFPKSCFSDVKMRWQDIIGASVGNENTFGACVGRVKPGPFTFARVSTDDLVGEVRAYVGQGEFTDDPLDTFGGVGVARIEELQSLLQVICQMGFEHHVALTHAQVGAAIAEAWGNYLGWDVYVHGE